MYSTHIYILECNTISQNRLQRLSHDAAFNVTLIPHRPTKQLHQYIILNIRQCEFMGHNQC